MKKLNLYFLTLLIITLITIFNCQTPSGSGGGGGHGGGDDDKDTQSIDYNAMVSITGGTYTQQSDENHDGDVLDPNESFSHTISSFSIGKYEVTYELWYTVFHWGTDNGYNFVNGGREGHDGGIGSLPTPGNHEPVTNISWRDVIVWCNAYSEKSGLSPCYYYLVPSAIIKDSFNATACNNATCNWAANGYRLPTEGEWQFAASNKGNTPFNYASGASDNYMNQTATEAVAWIGSNSGGKTHDVGTREANQLDLYDMSGNVFEFCWDWIGTYPVSAQNNYRGASSGSDRIMRGGSCGHAAEIEQVGFRTATLPDSIFSLTGFRIARNN
jgi:formylglycine-generating enzyme required for sulfatase activity